MNRLVDILYGVSLESIHGNTNIRVGSICFDSRRVGEGDVFVAIKGGEGDGHRFIPQAIDKGAAVIVCEDIPSGIPEDLVVVKVPATRPALSIMAANYYDNPSRELKLIGVTGTNGKTTVTTMLYELFQKLGYKAGLISTIRNLVHRTEVDATHTTPDPVSLNELLRRMADAGCDYVFMEVSSHAVDQDRISGLEFTGAIFTNISHDHLDYHKTFKAYIEAKKKFFDNLPSSAFALVNGDDRRGAVMLQNTKARKFTFSIKSKADFRLRILENTFNGLVLQIGDQELHTRLVGRFNAYNVLTVFAAATLLEQDSTEVLQAISVLSAARGRFEYIKSGKENILAIVDYAHTPDALKNVLATISEIRGGNEKLITLVGCGGNRDRTKRPLMAKIAANYSDKVILTSDNPRNEDPEAIIDEMKQGILAHQKAKVMSVVDRREAIRVACTLASRNDIVLVAGKGHETYQEVKGERRHFDDKEILMDTLKELDK